MHHQPALVALMILDASPGIEAELHVWQIDILGGTVAQDNVFAGKVIAAVANEPAAEGNFLPQADTVINVVLLDTVEQLVQARETVEAVQGDVGCGIAMPVAEALVIFQPVRRLCRDNVIAATSVANDTTAGGRGQLAVTLQDQRHWQLAGNSVKIRRTVARVRHRQQGGCSCRHLCHRAKNLREGRVPCYAFSRAGKTASTA